jgi:outer membrane cobalamin receptor
MKPVNILAAIFCAVPLWCNAATDNTLEEIVVTATRTPQPLNQSLFSASVITRLAAEKSGRHRVLSIRRYWQTK